MAGSYGVPEGPGWRGRKLEKEIIMSKPAHKIRIGVLQVTIWRTAAYTDNFVDRQHRCPSDLRSARGKVMAFYRLDSGVILADIEWDKHGLPKRVNIKNLTRA
jgi:hypothetical protein